MDAKNWWRSRSTRTIRLGRQCEVLEPSPSDKTKWKRLWKKFLKMKVFGSSARVHVQSPYDTEAYMKNFDEGQSLDESDFVLRSFSMRFAYPSNHFPEKDLIDLL